MRVLTVNAGSSSLKLSVLEGDESVSRVNLSSPGGAVTAAELESAIAPHLPVDAVGHRIVHGGVVFTNAVRIDEEVRRRLDGLVDLAPLHMPKSLTALDAVTRLVPDVPTIACFDTAFHADLPAAAYTYALPAEWRRRWPLRRFGFHGLSHAWASARAAYLSGDPVDSARVVSCHLGAGASLAAVRGGRSVDTTMGFTPLEGLVMATRSGSVDPGLVLWLEEHVGLPPAELASTLEHRSGLLGLTGSSDLRWVLEAEARGEEDATLAVSVYLHRLRAAIAAMAAAMGGLDLIAFTGGIGENAPSIRYRAGAGLGFLGVAIDGAANAEAQADAEITGSGAAVRTFVVEAREDLQIVREVATLLEGEGRR